MPKELGAGLDVIPKSSIQYWDMKLNTKIPWKQKYIIIDKATKALYAYNWQFGNLRRLNLNVKCGQYRYLGSHQNT